MDPVPLYGGLGIFCHNPKQNLMSGFSIQKWQEAYVHVCVCFGPSLVHVRVCFLCLSLCACVCFGPSLCACVLAQAYMCVCVFWPKLMCVCVFGPSLCVCVCMCVWPKSLVFPLNNTVGMERSHLYAWATTSFPDTILPMSAHIFAEE